MRGGERVMKLGRGARGDKGFGDYGGNCSIEKKVRE